MKKPSAVVLGIAIVAGLCFVPARSASAYINFSKAFLKKYAGDKSTDAQKSIDKEFARVKCAVCHDPRPGDDGKVAKKNRNPYGKALNKLLSKKDQKDEPKILEALSQIEKEKPEGSDKTFGELLSAGKLPFLYEGFDYSKGKDDEKN
jgi:hypothetical protein